MSVNASVEEILAQNDSQRIAIDLTNLIKSHSDLIDNGLKADIKMKQNKLITVQQSLDNFLSKPSVDFSDFVKLEELVSLERSDKFLAEKFA